MNGKFIGTVENTNVFTVQKEFTLEKIEKAVLTVTALGLYVAHINGQRVGDAYLTPGWTSYQKMLQYQEYDVTNLLKNGVNIELTQVEYQIMELFFNNPDKQIKRTEILDYVWGENFVGEEEVVDVNIRRLRMKIEEIPSRL